jgi:hypothetical protein
MRVSDVAGNTCLSALPTIVALRWWVGVPRISRQMTSV